MKGKNKLVPRLLGVTKDSVMRVDEKTKEVLQEWPLTTVKRWAASPKSFTLVIFLYILKRKKDLHGIGKGRQTCNVNNLFNIICYIWNSLELSRAAESYSNKLAYLAVLGQSAF